MRLPRLALVAALILGVWGPVSAGALLTGEEAPEWRVSEWINGDPGSVARQKGRVLVLHFFQMWCPGCNEFTIPVMQRWQNLWGDRDDFMIVSIHSVFEGHEYQTPERLRKFLRRKNIWHPVGIDAYAKRGDEVPVTMQRYKTTGTPQLVLIDKEGLLVFNHFGEFDIPTLEFLVERLLKEESEVKPPPKPQVGRDAKLSGTYKLQFEQTSKSCGEMDAPVSLNIKLDVITDIIEIGFPRDYLGVSELTARYNSRTLKFNASATDERQVQGTQVRTSATVIGRFVQGSRPPQITYSAIVNRISDQAELQCSIKARGTAVRIGD